LKKVLLGLEHKRFYILPDTFNAIASGSLMQRQHVNAVWRARTRAS